jgi:hypothetical protein
MIKPGILISNSFDVASTREASVWCSTWSNTATISFDSEESDSMGKKTHKVELVISEKQLDHLMKRFAACKKEFNEKREEDAKSLDD